MNIRRMEVGPRMSQVVIHRETVYTAVQDALDRPGASVTNQTQDVLERIERLLEDAGTDTTKILSATV